MNIEQLAEQAGFERSTYGLHSAAGMYAYNMQIMERFADLVRNAVLEEAAGRFNQHHIEWFGDQIQDELRAMQHEVKP
jgi:hypothetical protein